jgi:hypothetical protein
MPRYHIKKPTQTETREEIETSSNKYLLTSRESEYSTMIYIGGLDSWCLECQIIRENPVANMPKIEYDERCSLSGRFVPCESYKLGLFSDYGPSAHNTKISNLNVRGSGGVDTIGIMALMISYIQNKFPHVTHITFDDYSRRNCDDRQSIDLAPFYYLFDGKTWYMNKMGAQFFNTSDLEYFTNATKRFQELKPTMTWEDYDACVNTAHPLPDTEMRTIFEESPTWFVFFNELKKRVDIADLCIYMAPWIKDFVKRKAGLYFSSMTFVMNVPNPTLPTISYTLKPYVKSGGRYTRKQHRMRDFVDLK